MLGDKVFNSFTEQIVFKEERDVEPVLYFSFHSHYQEWSVALFIFPEWCKASVHCFIIVTASLREADRAFKFSSITMHSRMLSNFHSDRNYITFDLSCAPYRCVKTNYKPQTASVVLQGCTQSSSGLLIYFQVKSKQHGITKSVLFFQEKSWILKALQWIPPKMIKQLDIAEYQNTGHYSVGKIGYYKWAVEIDQPGFESQLCHFHCSLRLP